MEPIKAEELKKLPYLDASALDNRAVNLMPYWDGTNWHMWFNTPVGLLEGKIADVAESNYVGKGAARSSDLFIPFIHNMWQHASWSEIRPLIVGISDDFHNMGVSVAKLKHFHTFQRQLGNSGTHKFALTELEYLVTLCRTVFDLLQEMFAWIWKNRVQLLDERSEAFRLRHALPKTFSRMVLHEKERVRTVEEVVEQFRLPSSLAQVYADVAPFFSQLRRVRDKVVHGGDSFEMIFQTERGFCVDPTSRPFSEFAHWRPEHHYNEHLVSILPWIADVILQTINACNSLVGAFASVVRLPPAMAPGCLIFVRGYHDEVFSNLLAIQAGESVWWDDPLETVAGEIILEGNKG